MQKIYYVIFLFLACPAVSAQESMSSPQEISGIINEDVKPSSESAAQLRLGSGRVITIHREDRVGPIRSGALYFHKPLFVFRDNDQREIDHPIIWNKVHDGDSVFIAMKLLTTSSEFVELAKAAVLEQDAALAIEQPEVISRDVDVMHWPLRRLHLEFEHILTGTDYGATFDLKDISSQNDVVDIRVKIDAERYEEFIENLNAGNIQVTPFYTFLNRRVAFAQSEVRFSGDIAVQIANELSSDNVQEGEPIFQSEARELKNSIRQKLVTIIQASDADALQYVSPLDISNQLFTAETINLSDLEPSDPLLDKVESYLVAQINQIKSSRSNESRQTETDTNTNSTSVVLKEKPEVTISSEDIERLENEHKVKFSYEEDTGRYVPQEIEVTVVRSGWQDNITDIIQTINFAKGSSREVTEGTPFPTNYTEDRLYEDMSVERVLPTPFAGVPKGVALCSFRRDVPRGWIVLDGNDVWPEENGCLTIFGVPQCLI